ncbi:uncharacterized [Tachysurus ichikawai]
MQCPIRGSLRCHAALMRKESFPLCGLAEIDWSRKRVCGIGVGGIGKGRLNRYLNSSRRLLHQLASSDSHPLLHPFPPAPRP